MSYANMDGVPTQTAGTSEILASDWNTYVRDNFDSIKFGHVTVADDSAKSALSVAEGTMVYQLDNQKVFVYSGSAWVEVSDLDSTDGVSTTAQTKLDNIGLNKIAEQTITAASSVSFNDCFSSTYDHYLIVYGLKNNQGNYSTTLFRLRASGSDSSTNYWFYELYGTNSSGPSVGRQFTNQLNFYLADETGAGYFWVYNPNKAQNTDVILTQAAHGSSTSTGSYSGFVGTTALRHVVNTAYDGFSIIGSAGHTITGNIKVYGFGE